MVRINKSSGTPEFTPPISGNKYSTSLHPKLVATARKTGAAASESAKGAEKYAKLAGVKHPIKNNYTVGLIGNSLSKSITDNIG
jgi:hypothetical protein